MGHFKMYSEVIYRRILFTKLGYPLASMEKAGTRSDELLRRPIFFFAATSSYAAAFVPHSFTTKFVASLDLLEIVPESISSVVPLRKSPKPSIEVMISRQIGKRVEGNETTEGPVAGDLRLMVFANGKMAWQGEY